MLDVELAGTQDTLFSQGLLSYPLMHLGKWY